CRRIPIHSRFPYPTLFRSAVEAAVERQLKTLARSETASASWRDFGAVILVPELAKAVPLANRIAAEHLEIATADPDTLLPDIRKDRKSTRLNSSHVKISYA